MNPDRLPQNTDLYQEDGLWKLRHFEHPIDSKALLNGNWAQPVSVGPVDGPMGLSQKEAQRIAWKSLLSCMQQNDLVHQSRMTVAEFVERRFVPQHISPMRNSTRMYYQALLKYVLTSEDVNRMFGVTTGKSKAKLRRARDWPYLSKMRLCDVKPEDIQQLMTAALAQGYSTRTAMHIRNVISAIFAHAKQELCFAGDNPASRVKLTGMIRDDSYSLSSAKTKEALAILKYPEKEMIIVLLFTGMSVSEICGLQWKQVNLTEREVNTDGALVPPWTICVEKQWYRGELESVNKNRLRNLPIHRPLLEVLLSLSERTKFTTPDDFVLVSRTGTPVNETNVLARRLRPTSTQLGVPLLSWQVFLRTRKVLASEFGSRFQNFMAMIVRSSRVRDDDAPQKWHCRRVTRHLD